MTRDERRRVPAASMRELTGSAVSRAQRRQWGIEDLSWTSIRPDKLTDTDRSVVRFITFIEDHIPGYLSFFLDLFPTVGDDLSIEEFCFNREYFRFLIAWAHDEERHASVLTRYQVESGISDPDTLRLELAEEGKKKFSLHYEQPVQAFTYALVQEKATQLFYQRFRDVVSEPVLRDLLSRLARDEARHFAFYSDLLGEYVRRHGLGATVPDLKDVLRTFRMPLAETLAGYWRWSLRIADATEYDHTEAYEAVVRLVNGFASSGGDASAADLAAFVDQIRKVLNEPCLCAQKARNRGECCPGSCPRRPHGHCADRPHCSRRMWPIMSKTRPMSRTPWSRPGRGFRTGLSCLPPTATTSGSACPRWRAASRLPG